MEDTVKQSKGLLVGTGLAGARPPYLAASGQLNIVAVPTEALKRRRVLSVLGKWAWRITQHPEQENLV
jgi:hypothetical protein